MLDLKQPLDDLFYQVYNSTLNRDLPYFSTLKVKSRSFAPISLPLSLDKKRELCQFLEEALCNIGKHAQGVIRINAVGINTDGWYILSIKDNGQGKDLIAENLGTKQVQALAKKLGGQFRREKLHPKGVLCELRWQIVTQKTSKLSQWLKLIQSKLNLKN
jgi:two-component sensor histidine kinase